MLADINSESQQKKKITFTPALNPKKSGKDQDEPLAIRPRVASIELSGTATTSKVKPVAKVEPAKAMTTNQVRRVKFRVWVGMGLSLRSEFEPYERAVTDLATTHHQLFPSVPLAAITGH